MIDDFGTELLPSNPLRAPDRRWRRAAQLLETKARRRRRDDGWVIRARAFLTTLAGPGEASRHRLAPGHPDILGAYQIHLGDPRRRWELEARLLAGQGDGETAGRIGVEARVVGAYEALFYEVRDRLRASDWVATYAIGPRLYQGFDADDVEITWKALAYHGGPHALDAAIADFRPGDRPAPDPEMADRLGLLVKLMATPVTQENALGLLRLDALAREIERAEAARGVAAVASPIVAPPLDVDLGAGTVPLVRAGCAPDGPDGVESGIEGGPFWLSDAG